MKKAITVSVGIITILLLGYFFVETPESKDKELSPKYATKVFTTLERFEADYDEIAKEKELDKKDMKHLDFYMYYCQKNLEGKTYSSILSSTFLDSIASFYKIYYPADSSCRHFWEEKPPKVLETSWRPEIGIDQNTRNTIYYALIEAKEELNFESSYEGVGARIVIRKQNNETLVSLQVSKVSKGHFLTNDSGERTIRVKFDDQQAFNVRYSNPSDYSTDYIIIDNPKKMIAGFRSAKNITIQSEFYNEGIKTIEFNPVEGLKWDH